MALAVNEQNQVQELEPVKNNGRAIVVKDDGPLGNWLDTDKFCQIQRVAQVFAGSKTVPMHYRGNLADCIIAVQMAARLNVDPFMFMQKSYVVHGKPGIEAQLKIGLAMERGPFKGPIQWRFEGADGAENYACIAYAVHAATGEMCEMRIDWATVKSEGWLSKEGSKWAKPGAMRQKMFMYRSASWLIDLYCPQVVLGLMTKEEVEDSADSQVIDSPARGDASAFSALISEAEPAVQSATPDPVVPPRRKSKGPQVEEQTEIPVEAATGPYND